MVARVTYSKDMSKWSNAIKPEDLSDWPEPSSSFKGPEQTRLGELNPDIPTAIDGTVFVWVPGVGPRQVIDIVYKMS